MNVIDNELSKLHSRLDSLFDAQDRGFRVSLNEMSEVKRRILMLRDMKKKLDKRAKT